MSPSNIVRRKQAVINALKQAVQAFDLIEQQTARIKELEAIMPLYDELLTRCAIAEKQRDELLAALKYARELVDDWGAYASNYMQEKHDLAGDLDRLDAAISKVEEQS